MKKLKLSFRMIREATAYDPWIPILIGIGVCFYVTAPMLAGFLPSMIIDKLETGLSKSQMIGYILKVFALYAVLEAGGCYLARGGLDCHYEAFRVEKCLTNLLERAIFCDYQSFESAEVQEKVQLGQKVLSGSMMGGINSFFKGIETLLTCFVSLIIYLVLLTRVSFWLVAVLLSLSAVNYVLYLHYYKKFQDSREKARDYEVHMEYFSGIAYNTSLGKDIRLYQAHPLLKKAFDRAWQQKKGIIRQQEGANLYSDITGEVLSFLRDIICYGYLIYLMAHQQMSAAEFVFYLAAITGLSTRFFSFVNAAARMNTYVTYIVDYYQALDAMEPSDGDQTVPEGPLDIQLEDVSFTYPGTEKPALDHLNLHIHPGEKIGLVGLNGAGKTTLVKLICGLYHPDSGRILVNGIDLAEVNKADYYKHLGVAFQDSALFGFTLGENISGEIEGAYSRQNVDDILEQTGLKQKVDSLPHGMQSYYGNDVEPEGVKMSGGEAQKAVLTRAFFHHPKLVVLDEPTSAMDAIHEKKLYEEYDALVGENTAFFISHRLASTRFCSRIILLQDGRVMEEGTHDALMRQNGVYASLFDVQRRYYQEDPHENQEISA